MSYNLELREYKLRWQEHLVWFISAAIIMLDGSITTLWFSLELRVQGKSMHN